MRLSLYSVSAVNVGKIKSDEELEDLCDLSVRSLDELIDYQDYPIKAAEMRPRLVVLWVLDSSVWATTWLNWDTSMVIKRAWDACPWTCTSPSSITF